VVAREWWAGRAHGRVEAKPGQRLEDKPAGRLGRAADIQPSKLDGRGDGLADRALDQAEHQQRQADHADQRGDASVVFEEHRRDAQRTLNRAVAALDCLLALVAAQDLGSVGLLDGQVGQQPVPAVGGRLGVQGGLVKPPRKGRLAGGRVGACLGAKIAGDLAAAWSCPDLVDA
jgi:hypothetical protein